MKQNSYATLLSLFVIATLGLIAPSPCVAQWTMDTRVSAFVTEAWLNDNAGRCLAVSGDSIHAVWTDAYDGERGVYYRHSYDGGLTWTGQSKLTGPTSCAQMPAIAVSGSTVHIVWRDTIGSQYVNYYTRSLDGGLTWGEKVSFGNWSLWPSIACSGRKVFVALNSDPSGRNAVWVRRSTDNGTTWDSVQQVSHAFGNSTNPSIAASDGHVYLVWNDDRDSGSSHPSPSMQAFGCVSSDDGLTWGSDTLWNAPPIRSDVPVVHASGPNVDFIWCDWRLGSPQVFYKHSSDHGATWSAEQALSTQSGCYSPSVARNANDVWATWSVLGDSAGISLRHSGDGGVSWGRSQQLVGPMGAPSHPYLAADDSVLHTIWLDKRDGSFSVYYKRTDPESITARAAPSQTSYILAFGSVKVGDSVLDSVLITNAGPWMQKMPSFPIEPAGAPFAATDELPYRIGPGVSSMLHLRFAPTAQKAFTARVALAIEGVSNSFDTIILTGIGVSDTSSASVAEGEYVAARIEVSPNPASREAMLRLTLSEPRENIRVELYDEAGRIVATEQMGSLDAGPQEIPLQLGNFSGVAFIRVLAGQEAIGELRLSVVK